MDQQTDGAYAWVLEQFGPDGELRNRWELPGDGAEWETWMAARLGVDPLPYADLYDATPDLVVELSQSLGLGVEVEPAGSFVVGREQR